MQNCSPYGTLGFGFLCFTKHYFFPFHFQGQGVVIHVAAVSTKPHQDYFEGELNAGWSRFQSSEVPAVSPSPVWSL